MRNLLRRLPVHGLRGHGLPVLGGLLPLPRSRVWPDVLAGVIAIVLGTRALTRRIPGALIAVVLAITASRLFDLASHGVAVVGTVPSGLPSPALPALDRAAATRLLGTAVALFVVILAQSAATSRAYAAKYDHVLVKWPAGYWQPVPVTPGARTEDGLVIYRFGTSLYYANAAKLIADLQALVESGGPLRWLVLDCAAVEDIDYTASTVLARAVDLARQRHVRFAVSTVVPQVQRQLDSFGITKTLDPDARYETPRDALDAFHATAGGQVPGGGQAGAAG